MIDDRFNDVWHEMYQRRQLTHELLYAEEKRKKNEKNWPKADLIKKNILKLLLFLLFLNCSVNFSYSAPANDEIFEIFNIIFNWMRKRISLSRSKLDQN